jgi:hypothetical protein
MNKIFILLPIFLLLTLASLPKVPIVYAQTASIIISPDTTTTQGSYFVLNITTNNVTDLYCWSVTLDYRKAINMTDAIAETSFFNGSLGFSQTDLNYSHYRSFVYGYLQGNVSGVTGNGVVATMNFTAVYNGTANMKAYESKLLNSPVVETAHTISVPTVNVDGTPIQYFLSVETPQYGSLNTTSGVYNNGTNVVINATETTGTFQYVKVDSTYYTIKTVTITMNSDHKVSASFQIPTLTITTEPNADIWVGTSKSNSGTSGVLSLQRSYGTYTVKVSKIGFYDALQSVTMDANKTLEIKLYEVRYAINVPLDYKTILLKGTAYYSNWSKTYVDFDGLIEVQVLEGTTGQISLLFHYDTDYPIVEIDAENLTLIEFDLEAVYQHYCLSSYEDMQQTSYFTGLRISSNTLLQINLEMPWTLDFWHRPTELIKIDQDGGISSFSSWQYSGRMLTLNFEPGDPTISMIFHAEPDAMTFTFWNLIPFIFVVGSIILLIGMIMTVKGGNFKEFAVLLAGFLIVTALIPIVPQIVA